MLRELEDAHALEQRHVDNIKRSMRAPAELQASEPELALEEFLEACRRL